MKGASRGRMAFWGENEDGDALDSGTLHGPRVPGMCLSAFASSCAMSSKGSSPFRHAMTLQDHKRWPRDCENKMHPLLCDITGWGALW